MNGKRHVYVAVAWGLASFSSLAIAISLLFSSVDISHAQTAENRPPAFEAFRFNLTVDEGSPVGAAIGDPLAATDPDGDPLYFALVNGHTDLFSIDSGTGQLRVKEILDFEAKEEEDYWLHVSVRDSKDPSGGRDLVADDQGLVVIQIANVDEPGTVSINWKRPWVGKELVAAHSDPDGDVTGASWQWGRSNTRPGTYASIPGETANTYTPVSANDGKYLRVTINYTDPQGSGKSATFTFASPVASVTIANQATLNFTDGESTTRSVTENTPPGANIGSPIRASGGSGLLYTLSGTDASSFNVNPATGQLRTKEPLDYEDKNSYSVSLQVTNLSGGSDSINVTINVNDEPVEILGPARVEYSEGDYIYSSIVHHYNIVPGGAELTLMGTDARHFSLADSPGTGSHGRLTMNEQPDYEAPHDSGRNNVYNISITASHELNGTTHTKRLNVQVVVVNQNEGPTITGPDTVEFTEQTTGPVARYTARDPENDPIRWSIQDTDDWTFFQISRTGILSFKEPPDFENPGVEDNIYELVVLAQSGMNQATDGERIQVTVIDGADPPLFDQGYSEPRTVSENAERDTSIGQPVSATGGPGATLTYTLRGSDSRHFSIAATNGQLKTKAALNYESRSSYSLMVRASDGSLSTDAAVTINVLNEDEPGTVAFSTTQPKARTPFTATLTDPDGNITGASWTWEVSSGQGTWTTISGATSATYAPSDDDVGKTLRATVSYTDGHGWGKSAHSESASMVGTGPNRSPSFTRSGDTQNSQSTPETREIAENTAAGTDIGDPVSASDLDGDTLTYALVGGDAGSFDIVATSGQLKTKAALDYEGKSSYVVVVRARDQSNAFVDITVNISVTDVDEAGRITLSPSTPRVGAAVTATVMDPDGGVSLATTTWQWKFAETATGTEQNINGATGRSHTPAGEQQGKYLRATATYTDSFGANKNAQSDLLVIGAARAPRNTGGGNNGPDDDPNDNGDGGLNQPPNTGANPFTTASLSATYNAAAYRVNEGSSIQVTVRLSTAAAQAVRIPVIIGRDSAESGDYRVSGLSGGSLDFNQGSRSASFTVTAIEDDDTDNETLNLGFGTLTTGITAGSIPRATLTINDNDQAMISVSYDAAAYSVTEGSSVAVTVRLSTAAAQGFGVPITIDGRSAEPGDYRISGLSGGSLSFRQGGRSASFTISALQDDDTDNETLNLGFGTLTTGITAGSIPRATLTIYDNDQAMISVTYDAAAYSVTEGSTVAVTVRLSTAAAQGFRIPISITRGTAERGDYRILGVSGSSLSFGQGSRSASFTVMALQDDDADNETLNLAFGTLAGGVAAGSIPSATLTIVDDGPPTIFLDYSSSHYYVNEGAAVRVTGLLSTAADRRLEVPVAIRSGTAESNDYRVSGLSHGSLIFSQGSQSASFTITSRQDDDGDDETLNLGFGSLPRGVSAGPTPTATLTINDDDVPTPLKLTLYYRSPRYAVFEGNSISVTVRLSDSSNRALRVPIATNNETAEEGDYQLTGLTDGALNFGPGDRSQSFTFTALQDDDADDELVNLSFGTLPPNTVTDFRSGGTVTIGDDDLAPVLRQSVNGPPWFTEGVRASRTVAEQAARGAPVGLPVTAIDPDGDILTYYLSGIDASYFSLDSRTGQLQVWRGMDFELKSAYLVTLSVSDGRGGTDSITVSINLTDIQEVPITNATTQSVSLATSGTPFSLETPDGVAAIHLPVDFSESPIFVRLESLSVNCGGIWPVGASLGFLTAQAFDTWGSPIDDLHMGKALFGLRFDANNLGGPEAVSVAHEEGAIQVYRFRKEAADWVPEEFALEMDELGVVSLTVSDLRGPSCLAALAIPLPQEPALSAAVSDPTPEPSVVKTPGRDGRSPRAISTPEPVVGAVTDSEPPGSDDESGPTLVQASIVGDTPWWPRTFIIVGGILLVAAIGWQFILVDKDRRRLQKTFTRTTRQSARDVTRI